MYRTRFVSLKEGKCVEGIVSELLPELPEFPQWAVDMGFEAKPIVYKYTKDCVELTEVEPVVVGGICYSCYEVPCDDSMDGSVNIEYTLPEIDPPGIFGEF